LARFAVIVAVAVAAFAVAERGNSRPGRRDRDCRRETASAAASRGRGDGLAARAALLGQTPRDATATTATFGATAATALPFLQLPTNQGSS
jgi:hypothetical protein